MLADFFGGYFNLKVAVAAGVKVNAVAAAEVTALAGLAAEVRRRCFHRSIGVHPVLLSAAVAVVAIAVDVMDLLPLPSHHVVATLASPISSTTPPTPLFTQGPAAECSSCAQQVTHVDDLAGSSWLPGSCSRHSGANLPSESPAIGAALSGRKKTAVWR